MWNETSVADRTLRVVCEKHGFAECHLSVWLWRVIPITLLIIGTLGNVMSIVVLARPRMRKYSTTVYLMFMAVSDTTVLWTGLFRMTILRLFDIDVRDWSGFFCNFMQWTMFTFAGFSIWILVIMTMERVYRVKRPSQAREVCVPKNALIVTLATLTIMAISTGHVLFGFRTRLIQNRNTTGNETLGKETERCIHVSDAYSKFYNGPFMVVVSLIGYIIPMLLILVGNIIVAVKIKVQSRLSGISLSKKERHAVKLLFVLCTFFLLTTTPFYVYKLASNIIKRHVLTDVDYVRLKLASTIAHCLMWCNFTFNFILYFVSGSLFKNEWKSLMCCAFKDH